MYVCLCVCDFYLHFFFFYVLDGISDIASKPVPIIFFCNKKDLPHSIESAEISKILDLPRIANHPWHIQYDCAVLLVACMDVFIIAFFTNEKCQGKEGER